MLTFWLHYWVFAPGTLGFLIRNTEYSVRNLWRFCPVAGMKGPVASLRRPLCGFILSGVECILEYGISVHCIGCRRKNIENTNKAL